MRRLTGLLCLLLSLVQQVRAATPHESYLTLTVDGGGTISGEWKVRLADLAPALGLAAGPGTGWPQLEHRREDIEAILSAHLKVRADGTQLAFRFIQLQYGAQDGEPFILARLIATAAGEVASVTLDPALPLQREPDSRCQVKVIWTDVGMHQGMVTGSSGPLEFARATAGRSGFLLSLNQGVWHIWTGYDHILFLLTLLIPSVFRRIGNSREAVPRFGSALLRVVIIVSAFTLAHSITLTCAALQWVSLPSRLVESAIALSIFVAALFNFLPTTAGGRGAWLAFGFGLLHGFGFAGALSELGSQGGPVWQTIVGFNLGVESGQLAIVAVFLPMAFLLRETRFYRTGVVYGGSTIAALCAIVWFCQRAFL
jgi:HupE / UreJ protein